MNKFIKVFFSQAFNSFFPLVIVAILLHISDKNNAAPIFIILNYSNIFLLFSDYSSNIRFLKDAMNMGGINKNPPVEIKENIRRYIGVKLLTLVVGFLPWLAICIFTPLLHFNLLASVLSYTFIISYNLNFYWIYAASNKEYYFIFSNLCSRLVLILLLLAFLHWQIDFTYLMCSTGLIVFIVSIVFFKRFCISHDITLYVDKSLFLESYKILKSDFKLVVNNSATMVPTICLGIFVGYIGNATQVVVYAVAEKVFLGIRTLLSISINSIYPVLCGMVNVPRNYIIKISSLFYFSVVGICVILLSSTTLLIHLFHLPVDYGDIFKSCLTYFILTIMSISLNVPFLLWQLVNNHMTSNRTSKAILSTAPIIVLFFFINLFTQNTVISLVKVLFASELLIAFVLLLLYKSRRPTFSS
jgi:hypothetical protein